jgi:hypothetical protein
MKRIFPLRLRPFPRTYLKAIAEVVH